MSSLHKIGTILADIIAIAPPQLVVHRNLICDSCPANVVGVCSECGCVLAAKTRLLNSHCPIGLWEAAADE